MLKMKYDASIRKWIVKVLNGSYEYIKEYTPIELEQFKNSNELKQNTLKQSYIRALIN